jgi:hypothetical protein
MRTKALFLAAAISAAGLATASAQAVYSVNVVGYVNLEVPAGFSLIANQLDNGQGNLLNDVLPNAPFGASIFKFDPAAAAYVSSVNFGDWSPNLSLAPGEGAFISLEAPATLTFVGEVMQGNLSISVPAGFSIRSSMVPQSATLEDLGFPVEFGDTVYFYRNGEYESSVAFGTEFSPPAVPEVGEAFFINNGGAERTWARSFSVN